ncbi:MAG TPA: hypothetical protein VHB98_18495 [Chloroflexota bacterium]|nr:hypothetical protein [Chloroflexota bacterium]
MASFATTLKRSIVSLALVGTAALAVLGSGSAHAGPGTPVIAAKAVQYATELRVTGSGFGAGDPVIVYAINNDTHQVETSATTTASVPHIICWLGGTCVTLPGGTIYVTTPPVYIHCGYAFVTVYAIDQKTGAHSNYVQATLGLGPC